MLLGMVKIKMIFWKETFSVLSQRLVKQAVEITRGETAFEMDEEVI